MTAADSGSSGTGSLGSAAFAAAARPVQSPGAAGPIVRTVGTDGSAGFAAANFASWSVETTTQRGCGSEIMCASSSLFTIVLQGTAMAPRPMTAKSATTK